MNIFDYLMIGKNNWSEMPELKPRDRGAWIEFLDKKTTSELLDISIAKWHALAKAIDEEGRYIMDGGIETCALCQRFHSREFSGSSDGCDGCPIKAYTGLSGCGNTPYEDYEEFYAYEDVLDPQGEHAIELAQAEAEFLERVREKGY